MLCLMRRLLGLVAVLATVLLFSGCFKLDMDLEVQSDESISGTMIIGLEKELATMGGQDPSELFGDSGDLPEGATTEEWSDDRFIGQKVTFSDVPLSEFTEGMAEDGDEFTLTKQGDEFVFDATFDLTQDEAEGFDPTEMMKGAELRVSLTFPGRVKESNGDEDGRTVTWEPKVGEKNEMHAVASAEGSVIDTVAGFVLPVGAGLVFIGLIAGLLFFSKRSTAGPADASAAPYSTPGSEAPVMPVTSVTPDLPGTAPAGAAPDEPGEAETEAPGDSPSDEESPVAESTSDDSAGTADSGSSDSGSSDSGSSDSGSSDSGSSDSGSSDSGSSSD